MTRLPSLEFPLPPDIEAEFAAIMPAGMPPLLMFRVLATSRRAWRKFIRASLLDEGPLSIRQREIVILRTCALAKCEYEWGVHVTFFATAAGLTQEEVAMTVMPDAAARGWTPSERALLVAADSLHRDAALGPVEFGQLRGYFDGPQILEIIQLCGFYRTVACLVRSLDLPCEPYAARFPHS